MLIAVVALVAGCLGSVVGVVAALKWGPTGSTTAEIAAAPLPVTAPSLKTPSSEAPSPEAPSPDSSIATAQSTSSDKTPSDKTSSERAVPEPALPSRSGSLAFAEASAGDDQSQWTLQLDPDLPKTEGLTIKGSGAQTNYPLLMVRDFNNAPIAWIAPHGGLSVTDNIRVKSGVFKDDGVSMRRWTDTVAGTGPGGFSWDGAELVRSTVGPSGSAEALPDAPELWLRIMDNTGDEPRYLVIPAFLEEPAE